MSEYDSELEKYKLEYMLFAKKFKKEIWDPVFENPFTKLDYPLLANYKQATKDWWDKVAVFEKEHPTLNPLEYLKESKPSKFSEAQYFIRDLITRLNGSDKGILDTIYVRPNLGSVLKLSPLFRIANIEERNESKFFIRKEGSICDIKVISLYNESKKANVNQIICVYNSADEDGKDITKVKGFELALDFDLTKGFLMEVE